MAAARAISRVCNSIVANFLIHPRPLCLWRVGRLSNFAKPPPYQAHRFATGCWLGHTCLSFVFLLVIQVMVAGASSWDKRSH